MFRRFKGYFLCLKNVGAQPEGCFRGWKSPQGLYNLSNSKALDRQGKKTLKDSLGSSCCSWAGADSRASDSDAKAWPESGWLRDVTIVLCFLPGNRQFSPRLGVISLLNYLEAWRRRKNNRRILKKNPVETLPRNCGFLSLIVVERVLILSPPDFPEISGALVEFGRSGGNSGSFGKTQGNSMEFSGARVLYMNWVGTPLFFLSLFLLVKRKEKLQTNKDFLIYIEPLESLEKKGETHKKAKKIVARNKRRTLKTLTSLNKEVRPFLLGDNSIWSFPSFSSLSDYSIWRSGRLF